MRCPKWWSIKKRIYHCRVGHRPALFALIGVVQIVVYLSVMRTKAPFTQGSLGAYRIETLNYNLSVLQT